MTPASCYLRGAPDGVSDPISVATGASTSEIIPPTSGDENAAHLVEPREG